MIKCLTKNANVAYRACDPDYRIGNCSPEDMCGPDYDTDCMPDCNPEDA